jgi:hypothetical protein
LDVLAVVDQQFGGFSLTGGETRLGKEAQGTVVLGDEVRKQFDECVAALTDVRYGPRGRPRNTTFAEIEPFGHDL